MMSAERRQTRADLSEFERDADGSAQRLRTLVQAGPSNARGRKLNDAAERNIPTSNC